MSEVVYQWHPDVIADFRELPEDLRAAYLEKIEAIKADPKVGEHLDRRASTGDLSAYRKVKFGRDTPRGPSHRIVYQLLPDSYTPSRLPGHRRALPGRCVRPRRPTTHGVGVRSGSATAPRGSAETAR